MAANLAEISFGGDDLAAGSVGVVATPDGRPGIAYRLRDERAARYADWSQKLIGKHTALIVDGEVVSAPYFVSRIPGVGQITGNFTAAEAENLAARLRLGDRPIAPVLLREEPASPPGSTPAPK